MADQDLDHSVYVARPRRVRMIAIVASIALCVLGVIGWLLLPTEIRALFPLSHRLGLLGILAFPIVVMAVLASSYVRADESGLRIRNALACTPSALGACPQDHSAARGSMGSTVAQTC